jgi:hypothetical protein
MDSQDRIAAVVKSGFTERQARFLVLVMQHSGVCLLRQYSTFAGIVHGQKTRKFFAKLVSRRFATAYACRHNRGHVYHVHHKALYRAIGETDSRHRRPLSPHRIVQGLATVDAVLATPTIEYLATADERTQRLSVGVHLFKDKHPVGVDPDVLARHPVSDAHRQLFDVAVRVVLEKRAYVPAFEATEFQLLSNLLLEKLLSVHQFVSLFLVGRSPKEPPGSFPGSPRLGPASRTLSMQVVFAA